MREGEEREGRIEEGGTSGHPTAAFGSKLLFQIEGERKGKKIGEGGSRKGNLRVGR